MDDGAGLGLRRDASVREDHVPTTSVTDAGTFRDAMSRFASSVHIVTTDGPAGRRGVTATAVSAVSAEPATLLVCLNTSSPTNERFEANGHFAVNLLGGRDEALARTFAGEGNLAPPERFALADWDVLVTGAPVLRQCLAAFDCRLTESRVVATHRILIGEVAAVRLGAADRSLVYVDRGYRHV